jgi:hypothetical protein
MLGQRVRAGVAVQDSEYASPSGVRNGPSGVVLGIAGVNDHRSPLFSRKRELCRDCGELRFARRIVVVIVEAALTDRDSTVPQVATQRRDVARSLERGRIVRVHSRRAEHKAVVDGGESGGDSRGLERLTDTDDRERARRAGARDYGVAVAGERRVREVGVAVDEDVRAPVLRGHLRSIQRRIGAAT